jgi:NitT/TauT family transport system permease protein
VLGAELASVFLIFTAQAWNMAFSVYQSLRTLPPDLVEACKSLRFSPLQRFRRLELPFAMPGLIWNMMMSMSGAWFFVVASEAITVGNQTITLPGVGSYVATAIAQENLGAIGWAILAMLIVIVICDQLLFRPLVAWADKFRIDNEDSDDHPESWVLDILRRSELMDLVAEPFHIFMRWTYRLTPRVPGAARTIVRAVPSRAADIVWGVLLAVLGGIALWQIWEMLGGTLSWGDIGNALGLGAITMVRVIVLIALASVIWTPIGVYVGLRPNLARIIQPVAQFLAAFPANLLFPVVVFVIARYALNPDIALSPLMVLGTQWYILFNVIAGASAIPRELRDAASNLQLKGWLWWRKVALPGVFPYYVTGAITASGGSWNAAIVAEVATWGTHTLRAHGLGAYIADATTAGDFHRIVLGIATMSFYVVVVNRLFWRPLYWFAERRYRLT